MNCLKLLFSTLLFLFLLSPSYAATDITVKEKRLIAKTSKKGVPGYTGCEVPNLKRVPAYVFELMHRDNNNPPTCGARSSGEWQRLSRVATTKSQLDFGELPPGEYQVIVRIGQATGCQIKLHGQEDKVKSIVVEEEASATAIIEADKSETAPTFSAVAPEESIVDPFASSSFKVFPNPAQDQINIDLGGQALVGSIYLHLYDLLGQELQKVVFSADDFTSGNLLNIDLSQRAGGTYLLSLEDDHGHRKVQKLLLLKENVNH